MSELHHLRRQHLQLQAKLLGARAAFERHAFPQHFADATADLEPPELAYLLSWLPSVAAERLADENGGAE